MPAVPVLRESPLHAQFPQAFYPRDRQRLAISHHLDEVVLAVLAPGVSEDGMERCKQAPGLEPSRVVLLSVQHDDCGISSNPVLVPPHQVVNRLLPVPHL